MDADWAGRVDCWCVRDWWTESRLGPVGLALGLVKSAKGAEGASGSRSLAVRRTLRDKRGWFPRWNAFGLLQFLNFLGKVVEVSMHSFDGRRARRFSTDSSVV